MKFRELRVNLTELTDKEIASMSDEYIDSMVDELEWEDVQDLYPDEEEELEKELSKKDDEEDEGEEEELDEAISAASRIRKRMSFARNKPRTSMARKIKMRRSAPNKVILKRAKIAARRAMYKRLLRGRDKSQLSASEKNTIEARVSKMKNIQSAIALKMVPKLRKLEQKRLNTLRTKKK